MKQTSKLLLLALISLAFSCSEPQNIIYTDGKCKVYQTNNTVYYQEKGKARFILFPKGGDFVVTHIKIVNNKVVLSNENANVSEYINIHANYPEESLSNPYSFSGENDVYSIGRRDTEAALVYVKKTQQFFYVSRWTTDWDGNNIYLVPTNKELKTESRGNLSFTENQKRLLDRENLRRVYAYVKIDSDASITPTGEKEMFAGWIYVSIGKDENENSQEVWESFYNRAYPYVRGLEWKNIFEESGIGDLEDIVSEYKTNAVRAENKYVGGNYYFEAELYNVEYYDGQYHVSGPYCSGSTSDYDFVKQEYPCTVVLSGTVKSIDDYFHTVSLMDCEYIGKKYMGSDGKYYIRTYEGAVVDL